MAIDFITVNTGDGAATFAADLVRFKELYRQTLDLGEKLKDIMDHNTDGSSYTGIETKFGLPAGNGDEVYNLVAGTLAALKGTAQSSDGIALIGRVG
jgi:hypothetical protein